jgi:hypothetical protein
LVVNKVKIGGWVGVAVGALIGAVVDVSGLTEDKVQQVHERAKAEHDFLATILTGFQLELDDGVKEKVLLRSAR